MRLHANAQGFQTLEENPGIERAERWPGRAQEAHYLGHQLGRTRHHAAHAAALTIDIFG